MGILGLKHETSDTCETPVAGKSYILVEANQLKTKHSDGSVKVYSTGVTPEEVQDIVGALMKDSSTILVEYDDDNNALYLHVKDACIGDGKLIGGINANKLGDGSVSSVEFQCLHGVSSSVQGQLDGKSDKGHAHVASDVTDLDTAMSTKVNNMLQPGAGVGMDKSGGQVTIRSLITQYTDALAKDAVGQAYDSSTTVVFSYSSSTKRTSASVVPGGISHGALAGLDGDDHGQYHNDTRGDARYYTKTELDGGHLNVLYYTKAILDGGQLDGRYYTEAEVNALLAAKVNASLVGVANGLATLGSDGIIPSAQLPSFVDDVLEYDSVSAFPSSGESGKIYVARDTGKTYRWGGTMYVEISASPGSTDAVPEGLVNFYYTNARASAAAPVQSVAGRIGAIVLAKSDVGLGNVDNTSDSSKPISTATQAALNGKEASITAGAASQYWRGDKTWQTLDKASVGLENVDNTADLSKPISNAMQSALDAKEGTIVAGTTAQYFRGDKTWQTLNKASVGLGNVDNTSDANKPISTAVQTALNGKSDTGHTHTSSNITDFSNAAQDAMGASLVETSTLNLSYDSGTRKVSGNVLPGGIDHGAFAGLGDDDHTQYHTDVRGDVRYYTKTLLDGGQLDSRYYTKSFVDTALSGKEASIAAGTTSQYWRGDKTWQTLSKSTIGLGNVDNTSDLNKPISTATQSALDGKVATSLLGVANGVATLGANGVVPSAQLPSYVDDVLEYPTYADFPATGESGKIYVAVDTNKTYRWGGTVYVPIVSSPGSTDAVPEGTTNLYFTVARASAAAPVQSVAGRTGVIVLAKADVGLANVDNTSDVNKPVSVATQTALGLKENTVTAGTTSQYYRGDKTWQTLDKSAVGLGNVDNTADLNKPISTATQSALNAKENSIASGSTAQYWRGDKTWQTLDKTSVGLGNVDNTSDLNKPVSTDTQTALNAKENTVSAGTTAQYYRGDKTWQTLDKTAVGLGNVNNTADTDKPVSSATQTALNAKENSISTGTTAQYWRGDKTWQTLDKGAVGLGNVDNTSDLSKPISTAAQTALDGKSNVGHTHTLANITDYVAYWVLASDRLSWSDGSGRALAIRQAGYPAYTKHVHSKGTLASPTQTASGDIMGGMRFFGWNNTAGENSNPSASIVAVAAEAHTSAAQGAALDFYVTPIGTTTQVAKARLRDDGDLQLSNGIIVGDSVNSINGALKYVSNEFRAYQNGSWVVLAQVPTSISSTTASTTTSSTFSTITSMSVTPAAGTYKLDFTAAHACTNSTSHANYSMFIDGVETSICRRTMVVTAATVAISTLVTVNGSQTITIKFNKSSGPGTVTCNARELLLTPVSR